MASYASETRNTRLRRVAGHRRGETMVLSNAHASSMSRSWGFVTSSSMFATGVGVHPSSMRLPCLDCMHRATAVGVHPSSMRLPCVFHPSSIRPYSECGNGYMSGHFVEQYYNNADHGADIWLCSVPYHASEPSSASR